MSLIYTVLGFAIGFFATLLIEIYRKIIQIEKRFKIIEEFIEKKRVE